MKCNFFILSFLSIPFFSCAQYYSQVGQDAYLNEHYFHNKKNGFFVDIGAHNGVTHSNSFFFERELGWHGICIEPLGYVFEKLKRNRRCICLNVCISNHGPLVDFIQVQGLPQMLSGMVHTYDPRHLERLKKEVEFTKGRYDIMSCPALSFEQMVQKYQVTHIDYLSVDTEGSEFEILISIDFNTVSIFAISVENNFKEKKIQEFLETKGFELVAHLGDLDDIFINHINV